MTESMPPDIPAAAACPAEMLLETTSSSPAGDWRRADSAKSASCQAHCLSDSHLQPQALYWRKQSYMEVCGAVLDTPGIATASALRPTTALVEFAATRKQVCCPRGGIQAKKVVKFVRGWRQGSYRSAHCQGGTIRRTNAREGRPLVTAERRPPLAVVSRATRESASRAQRRLQQAFLLNQSHLMNNGQVGAFAGISARKLPSIVRQLCLECITFQSLDVQAIHFVC